MRESGIAVGQTGGGIGIVGITIVGAVLPSDIAVA
jgi:hypothetical protein